ncbi:Uncharacterized protein MCB1EB_0125 [Mycoavidus cysteinexigens]|uniref:Uncharacterized protein n=1 Tax=Mycoavidus cysteinexigens TaxID=1553431 RepID=A0A2Z6ESA1_9BURK|nr:hypothetical protein [Mycoavidus cysteinexigens]BBE08286.1 Uncharacterized protein MCB1EB_0125 [Mycoavidus cysteinexigens]GAM53010.1 hypothetical protein EBME_1473 [bacterium endosymbiont of Mortierella elongata FMR23-6]GLR00791.1 hypothetical protein GCM10007934_06030 [Mycoavidus cysteinexigens]
MNNLSSIAASASTQTTVVSCLSLLEQGQSALRRAEEQRQKSPEGALDSFNLAQENFSDALRQNKALSYNERRDIEAGLVRAYFESRDILRSLRRREEARASYEKARPYCPHEEIEQKLSSLSFSPQIAHEEREEIIMQLAGGLAGSAVEGLGHTSNVHYNPTALDRQLLAESQRHHSQNLATALSTLSQLPAVKGRKIVFQASGGVLSSAIAGENINITATYGLSSTSAVTPASAIPGDVKQQSKELSPPPEEEMEG